MYFILSKAKANEFHRYLDTESEWCVMRKSKKKTGSCLCVLGKNEEYSVEIYLNFIHQSKEIVEGIITCVCR